MVVRRTHAASPGNPRGQRLARAATGLPLAIGLGANLFLAGANHPHAATALATTAADATPVVCEDVIDSDDCHSRYPAGCNASGSYDAALSFLKDRIDFPTPSAVQFLKPDNFAELEKLAAKEGVKTNDHHDHLAALAAGGEGKQFGVVGFLYPSKVEGSESSNCQLAKEAGDDAAVDFHIYIGFDADIAAQLRQKKAFTGDAKKALNRQSVIVEMTPHYRAAFHEDDWTFDNIKKLLGRQVKVTGQLLLDNEHNIPSQNCGLPGANLSTCWRASAWELHPVTEFLVCNKTDASCAINGSQDWIPMAQAVAGT
jgi:hypothetical protein